MSVKRESTSVVSSPPLDGVRVLDLATAMAGPYAATLLADLGASVIKVEKPLRGDLTRYSDQDVGGESSYFLGINRGKRGMTIDLRNPKGQRIVKQLSNLVDVVIENFRPGMMESWNLGFDELLRENPRLIYCSVSAYGGAAGYERAIGNDMTCQAYSGMMDMTGEVTGSPQRVGAPVIDTATAMQAALGITAALFRRNVTGKGEHVKVSLIETAFAMMPNYVASVVNSDTSFHRMGLGHPRFAPYGGFQCLNDEWLVLGTFHNRSWRALCHTIGKPELLDDPRFSENWDRFENKEILHKTIGDVLAVRERDYWVTLLQSADVPCAPILPAKDAIDRYAELQPNFLQRHQHSTLGEVSVQSSSIHFEREPFAGVERPAPSLGEDTVEILREIGLNTQEIEDLKRERVV
jgi:crotonobetainyl-CoA:carnitine CoA-transferase CaiB-like acyl-CoA transferase